MSGIYNTLQRLIKAKRDGVLDRINNIYAFNQISDDEYKSLMKLYNEVNGITPNNQEVV